MARSSLNVVVVEDDESQAEQIKSDLAKALPRSSFTVLTTELSFCQLLALWTDDDRADLVIMDGMLPYGDAPEGERGPGVEPPGHFAQAGVRCLAALRNSPQGADVPAILFSILAREDLAPLFSGDSHTAILMKGHSPNVLALTARGLLAAGGRGTCQAF